MTFTLPRLSYAYDALAPYIDAKTMEIHHSKHHQGYVNNLNAALEGTGYTGKSLETVLKSLSDLPAKKQIAVRNNAGGHYNHTLFWNIIGPQASVKPSPALSQAIDQTFGSFDAFKTTFAQAAATRFGSGWAWLAVKVSGELCVCSTPNQDNPLMAGSACPGAPILGLDVWEHAYYLNYQNRRPDYISAFWNIVNWEAVNQLFEEAQVV